MSKIPNKSTVAPAPDQYVNYTTAAVMLCVTERTIYGWVRSGKLKRFSVQGKWMVRTADLADLSLPVRRRFPKPLSLPE
jgi:hypothetical protein